ncbi:hypothetical protein PRO82_000238 [Candidatus Protochlamydia amoebophila]|nr:hypothetical protein [Candidatus Protochlamydia amoebophila]
MNGDQLILVNINSVKFRWWLVKEISIIIILFSLIEK